MKYKAIIFNDKELDVLLSSKKNILAAKKSLILYFLTLPNLANTFETIFLPESILDDNEFIKTIISFFSNIGISLTPKLMDDNDSLEYLSNPLLTIKKYHEIYNFTSVHYPVNFGKRLINKSPRYEEYIIHSQYNWTNVAIIHNWCLKKDVKLFVEPNLYFQENSSEDFYIHMRQIFWEGIDLFKKLNYKFNKLKIIVQPFYPKLKGLRDGDILDPQNIANTTLRCINESLTKERIELLIKPCKELSLLGYSRYIRFFSMHNKENDINCLITSDCLKEYIKDWDYQESNLQSSQKNFIDCLDHNSGISSIGGNSLLL